MPSPLPSDEPRERLESRSGYRVAVWYPLEGFGGASWFSTEADALAYRRHLIEDGGYPAERTYLYKVTVEIIEPEMAKP